MTRLHFLLRAQTAYSLHSPFLFELYRRVISAPLPRRQRKALGIATRHDELAYKLAHYLPPDSYRLLPHPHRNPSQWQQLLADPRTTASIDLYHSGLVLFNPKLTKQHLLLR